MDYPTAPSEQLSRPLLLEEGEEKKFDVEDEEEAIPTESSGTLIVPASADKDENDDAQANNNDDGGQGGPAEGAADEEEDKPFTIKNEIVEMASLALPLAISFFCRMGMARYVHPCRYIWYIVLRKFRFFADALARPRSIPSANHFFDVHALVPFRISELPFSHNIVCLSLHHLDLISYYLQYGLGIRRTHSRQSKHGRNLPCCRRPIRYGGECSDGSPTCLQSGPQCPGRSGHW